MVRVYVNLYSAIVANVSNALRTLPPGKQPSFQALFEGAKVLLCAEVVRRRVPNHRACTANVAYPNTCSFFSVSLHIQWIICLPLSVNILVRYLPIPFYRIQFKLTDTESDGHGWLVSVVYQRCRDAGQLGLVSPSTTLGQQHRLRYRDQKTSYKDQAYRESILHGCVDSLLELYLKSPSSTDCTATFKRRLNNTQSTLS